MTRKKRIVIASHIALIGGKEYDGIGNVLKTTLNSITDEYVFVRNSMDGLLSSQVQTYRSKRLAATDELGVASRPAPVRYITEIVQTVKYFANKPTVDVYIGIDPLNALAGVILKKKGKVKKAVFYTADYSTKRFGNFILNKIYHMIDKYCVMHADEVWSVSTRICNVRKQMGLDDNKNIFLPNVPPIEYAALKNHPHNTHELITTGIIDKQLDFEGIIRAVHLLRDELPALRLTIIGNGPEEQRLKQLTMKLGVREKIEFTGRLSLEQSLERQSKAGVGLALYTGVWGFNQYGDSTKCREFFSFGLPVISTDTHSTVDELRQSGAGVIVEPTVDGYVEAIRLVMKQYGDMSEASAKLGKKYAGIHRDTLQKVIR